MERYKTIESADRADRIIKHQLQCLRDMVALSALPSMWIDLGPTAIADSLADVLLNIVRADLIYVRVKISQVGVEYEAARTSGHSPVSDRAQMIGVTLAPWLERRLSISAITIPNPIGGGRLRVLVVPIVQGSERGVVCVCSRLAEFPTEQDYLLARVACNQAAAGLFKYTASSIVLPSITANPCRSEVLHAVEYIKANLGSDVSLNTIAGVVGISANYLAALFKQATGYSLHQYVTYQRVERAKTLLLRRDLSIGEIASQVGFYDSSHLNRHFKRLTGITPRTMRKKS